MTKNPAYQWYPKDADTDEAFKLMTYEQQGIYRALLDHQWLQGSIPGEPLQIAVLVPKVSRARFVKLWGQMQDKFPLGADGRRRNSRLERQRQEQDTFAARASDKGAKGAASRWHRHSPGNGPGNAQAMPGDSLRTPDSGLRKDQKQKLSAARHAPQREPKTENGEDRSVNAFLRRFCEHYARYGHGAKYAVVKTRDVPLVRRLLALHGLERLEQLAIVMLNSDESFIVGSDRSIPVLSTKINWLESRLRAAEAHMSCPSCRDRGVFLVCYREDPDPDQTADYALCLCRQGQRLRSDRNAGRHTGFPLYWLLAARLNVAPERFHPCEELLEPDELAARGLCLAAPTPLNLADVGRAKPRTRL